MGRKVERAFPGPGDTFCEPAGALYPAGGLTMMLSRNSFGHLICLAGPSEACHLLKRY